MTFEPSRDVRRLLSAIREFHCLRASQHRGEQTTFGETRLRELRDLLEPRRAAAAQRTRSEFAVDEVASVSRGGASQAARVKRLGLRRMELNTIPQLPTGERLVLSVSRDSENYHFHARVLRSHRKGAAIVEILCASMLD